MNVPKVATAPNAPTVAQLAERHIIENEELRAENTSLRSTITRLEQEREGRKASEEASVRDLNAALSCIEVLEGALTKIDAQPCECSENHGYDPMCPHSLALMALSDTRSTDRRGEVKRFIADNWPFLVIAAVVISRLTR